MLVRQATRLFAERRVTLAYVWTRVTTRPPWGFTGRPVSSLTASSWWPGIRSTPRTPS